MFIPFHSRFICVPIAFLLTMTTFAVRSRAGDFDCGSDIVPVPALIETNRSPVHFVVTGNPSSRKTNVDDLCGWIDRSAPRESEPQSPVTTESRISATPIAASVIAATALSTTGIHLQQLAEPFALVGPYFDGPTFDSSLRSVRRLQSWFDGLAANAKSRRDAELQIAINDIALQEPIDVATVKKVSSSVMVAAVEHSSIEVVKLDALVGGSAFVFCIEEDYMAYDWAPRDLKMWSVLPSAPRPYSFRATDDLLADWVMGKDLEPRYTIASSPECLLDDLICRIAEFYRRPGLADSVRPTAIGETIARIMGLTEDMALEAVVAVASRLPKANRPSETGSKLLARAGIEIEAVPRIATAQASNSIR